MLLVAYCVLSKILIPGGKKNSAILTLDVHQPFLMRKRLTMVSSYISRLRIKLWISALEFRALVRRQVHLISTDPKARSNFLASILVAFLVTSAVLALVTGGFNEPFSDNMTEKQVARDFHNNPRYIDREVDVNYGQSTHKVETRRFTGDSTPFGFPVTTVSLNQEWPAEPPFTPKDFVRQDQDVDTVFYSQPRLLYHIDEPAVASLTQYYRNNIQPGSDILDICSSWVSHYPLEFPETMGKICATGISNAELRFNDQLTGGYKQANLNVDIKLPYPDNSFDVVTCVVSIDYLTDAIHVLKEVHRVLRRGGKVIISQSNRFFPTKVIAMWLKMNDQQHLELINGFFQYAGGFEPRKAFEISARLPDSGHRDPMFIVEAVKS